MIGVKLFFRKKTTKIYRWTMGIGDMDFKNRKTNLIS